MESLDSFESDSGGDNLISSNHQDMIEFDSQMSDFKLPKKLYHIDSVDEVKKTVMSLHDEIDEHGISINKGFDSTIS